MLLWFIPSFIIEGHIKFQLGVSENEDAFYFSPLSSWPSWLEASAFNTAVVLGQFLRAFLCFVCVHPLRRIFYSHGFQSKLMILKFLLPNLDVSAETPSVVLQVSCWQLTPNGPKGSNLPTSHLSNYSLSCLSKQGSILLVVQAKEGGLSLSPPFLSPTSNQSVSPLSSTFKTFIFHLASWHLQD